MYGVPHEIPVPDPDFRSLGRQSQPLLAGRQRLLRPLLFRDIAECQQEMRTPLAGKPDQRAIEAHVAFERGDEMHFKALRFSGGQRLVGGGKQARFLPGLKVAEALGS